jgi:hypothetical protein
MNASDRVRVSDLRTQVQAAKDVQELKTVLIELLGRIDAAYQDLIFQLRAEPTIFTVDPVAEAERVEGAKPGDVAIFKRNGLIDITLMEEQQ